MSYVAVDEDGEEGKYKDFPVRCLETGVGFWAKDKDDDRTNESEVELPKGSIEKLIGKKLTWEDEPVELKDEK